MTGREGRRALNVEVPAETHERLKDLEMPMWEAVAEAVELAHGADLSTEEAYRRRIREFEDKIAEARDEIARQEELVHQYSTKRDNLQNELNRFLQNRESYKQIQDRVLDSLKGSTQTVHAFPDDLRELRKRADGAATKEDVIQDLKNRRDERDLEIPDSQFTEGRVGPAAVANGGADQLKSVQKLREQNSGGDS